MTSRSRRVAAAGVTSALALTLSGVFAPAAFATEGDTVAPTSGAEFDATAQALISTDGVEAVASDGEGNVVLFVTEAQDELDAQAQSFIDGTSNVEIRVLDAPFEARAANDVVGGAGYFSVVNPDDEGGFLCSIGFSAWSPTGAPAVVTAGHCNEDGAAALSLLTDPEGDPAGRGVAPDDNSQVSIIAGLGELAFTQYGGPGNTPGTAGDINSIDFAVIDVLNEDLNLKPEVTDWTTPSDLSQSTIPVTSVGSATVGAEIARSGRSTGFHTGTVDAVEGWASVSGRQVYGFGAFANSYQGDSGGAIIQGNAAIGVLSGGGLVDGQDYIWGADLQAGLARAGGYTVALHIDAPALVSPVNGGNVETGAAITGTGPADSVLTVTPEEGPSFDVNVDAAGNFSFLAPDEVGTYAFSAFATKGFDVSDSASFSIDVVAAPLYAPIITNPANGAQVVTELTAVTGTGEAGATVTLEGDVEGTATVAADGTWSIPADLGYGSYEIVATQTRDDIVSDPAASAFSVVPAAPAITDPANGTTFAHGFAPTKVSGTGIDGATVSVGIGKGQSGELLGEVVVENGTWSIAIPSALAAGDYVAFAEQAIDGQTSAGATSAFAVAAPVPAPAGNGGGDLAETGVGPYLPYLGGSAILLLLLGGAFVITRRKAANAS
ncbi:hypothetical protein MN032_04200 [Agromyces atrinae]|uniref:LAETG motif-containing sortase-dependent surface protein n=1 Tax=Agromyces atrinae TaxID=592376 RepID=UPI001F55E11F|nr:LAETG motif-containing sortase-dependent surface protein [Agromyces atrinae]MCI2956885.1 hypothetical protein [Agromyces atrinae]